MSGTGDPRGWTLGTNHSAELWRAKLHRRGWTADQIDEAYRNGRQCEAKNAIHPENGATRYVHPETGRSIVVHDATGEVIHIGGDGFVY